MLKRWLGIFTGKKDGLFDAVPNVDQLNDACYQCRSCKSILTLPDFEPLSIANCPQCDTPFFVPCLVKRYWLYRPLGGGGMGSVYKAIAGDGDGAYAVKVLPREKRGDKRLIDALAREAAIGKSFGRHPHLSYIEDYGNYHGEYFSAMEFAEGLRMDEIIEMHEQIAPKFVLLWALHILSGLQRIWDCGYLFRDLKPQNIMVDKAGNALLFDYGLCMSIEDAADDSSHSDSVEGSPLYMPPERIVGAGEGMASEVYSLGLVMYHALTGKSFYTASGAYELAKKHVSSLRFDSIGKKMPKHIDPALVEVVDHMVARLPAQRYQTYKECAWDINDIYQSLD